MSKVGRRSHDDVEWQNVKAEVRKRDGGMCVLCRLLTPAEYKLFLKSKPCYIDVIDPAHYESVSGHLERVYDMTNIYSLCRPMHQRMDNFENPVTGEKIGVVEHEEWWQRIVEGAETLSKNNIFSNPNFLDI